MDATRPASDELDKITRAIQAQEALRGIVPDAQLDAVLADLRRRYAALVVIAPVTSVQTGNITTSGSGQVNIANGNIILNPPPDKADEQALRAGYLNWVLESAGQLSLAGIDPQAASEAEARLSLGAVYTALLTLTPESAERLERGQMAPEREARRTSAVEQLNARPRLVLLGEPGSGKSTFVNFVALCLAGQALGREDANLQTLTAPLPAEGDERRDKKEAPPPQPWAWGALLPVRVILRDFAARGLPPPGQPAAARHLWDFIAAELKSAALEAWAGPLQRALQEQGGLLLLDGLDEVPEAGQRRAQIKSAVEGFAAAYPKCRVLVTSRTYAYQKQEWRLRNFHETVLAPFSRGQIAAFVERWYAHIGLVRHLTAADAQGRAKLLEGAVLSSPALLGLAERPLLLTLMASLHAWRGGSLPEKREQLYADTVDLLLDWWESPKVVRDASGEATVRQPSLAEWLKVDRQRVRGLLEALAFKAHAAQPELTGTADIPANDLVSGLIRISQNPEVNPVRLVEYLSERAGLLLPRGEGVFTFPHRTFQEYLAACHLTGQDYPDQLAELACRDFNRWREVTLLAGAKAARGNLSAVWALVDALCYREVDGARCAEGELWGAHLAGLALQENIDPANVSERHTQKFERVKNGLVAVLHAGRLPAVERARAGDTLAHLGDPRFDPDRWYLPQEPRLGFVEIPAGPFWMGSDPNKDWAADDREQPQHQLHLPRFFMARYPVTVAQFRAFVDDSGYSPYYRSSLTGVPNHPVIRVTWQDVIRYCQWLNVKLIALAGQRRASSDPWPGLAEGVLRVTLPSEAEWEKAARGPDGCIYPWGEKFDPNRANTAETSIGKPSAVGCFPGGASPYGCQDLSGNVWEWTRSLWGEDWQKPEFVYPYDRIAERENLTAPGKVARVVRGGAFNNESRNCRCAVRNRDFPDRILWLAGFRVCLSRAPE